MVKYEMNDIQKLFNLDWTVIIFSIFIIMSAIISIVTIIGKFSEIIKKPVWWIKKKNEDHELVLANAKAIKELSERHGEDTRQSIRHDEIIRRELENLTDLFVKKQISDMRWEINNFATKISENKPCNKDCFQHCFRTYEDYEDILKERKMKNGEVEISMDIIRNAYQTKMQNGEI